MESVPDSKKIAIGNNLSLFSEIALVWLPMYQLCLIFYHDIIL
jgi:hypothetical protein